MAHHHDHHHHVSFELSNNKLNKAFLFGIVLNSLFVIVEFVMGLNNNSLALISDAGHNLSDVVSLILALLAFRLSSVKKGTKYTYGLQKSTILVALINAVLLIYVVVEIVWEAITRIGNPVATEGGIIAVIAFVGIVINGVTALLFFREKDKDINIKGAYLHMLADALVSAGVVIGGIVIYFTHFYWIDSVLSICVALIILIGTWQLLKESLRLSLDGVPHGIKIEQVEAAALKIEGVKGIHHIHVWAISTTQNAITAHVKVEHYDGVEQIKSELKHTWEQLNIHHSTIEFEQFGCDEKYC